jgi:hypothetical protein
MSNDNDACVPQTLTDFVFDLYDSVTLSQLTEEQSRLYNVVFRELSTKVSERELLCVVYIILYYSMVYGIVLYCIVLDSFTHTYSILFHSIILFYHYSIVILFVSMLSFLVLHQHPLAIPAIHCVGMQRRSLVFGLLPRIDASPLACRQSSHS